VVEVNLEEMARKLGISRPTMREMITRYPDFPVLREGTNGVPWQFDPEAVIAFVQARRAEEEAGKAERSELLAQISLPDSLLAPPEDLQITPSERLKNAQAMMKEDELRKQRQFLVATAEMRQRLSAAWTPLNQALQALPAAIGRRHNLPDDVVRAMRRYIEGQQRDLHRRLVDLLSPDIPAPPTEDNDAAPPA
jgi:phage terminase Nu1 subunit (DNA packaging protein)